ncbi:MAG TPA: RNA 2'-phosphotransferase [Ktedonobacterales bacterium]
MNERLTQLSKTVSHALRHAPWAYELELDESGAVPVDELIDTLRQRQRWADLDAAMLSEMIAGSPKQRFVIENGKICAFYGHSLPGKLSKASAEPPDILYHGTSPQLVTHIMAKGLLPMRRQYVHLSADRETAQMVGSRKASGPVILVVRARQAHAAGVPFYVGNEKVWLADWVPPEWLAPEPGGRA